jgi:hypothetical protein
MNPAVSTPAPPLSQPASVYVYFKVAAARRDAALAAISGLQSRLRASEPGLKTGLMQRADAAAHADAETWMETYEHASGISVDCLARLEDWAKALPAGLIGERHTEVFTPLVPGDAGCL